MSSLRRLFAVALALVLGACTVSSPTAQGDLADPVTLDRLGIDALADVSWRRVIEGIEVVGTTARPAPAELDRLTGAISEVPDEVWAEAGLRSIVRVADLGGTTLHPATTAYSRGPDIYFLDRTFADPAAGADRLALARILVHELAHVAQFATLEQGYVDAVLAGEITDTDTARGSQLVLEYAPAAGWTDTSGVPYAPMWVLPAARATGITEYGTTSPDEDMAEALAMVATGRAGEVSPDRVRWIEEWLGTTSARLAAGKPWLPVGAERVTFAAPAYDEAAVGRFNVAHVEPASYLLPADQPAADDLARLIGTELRNRGMAGSLDVVDDPRLPRYGGRFLRPDGTSFWVELWDFRAGSGFGTAPPGPVLTYVLLW